MNDWFRSWHNAPADPKWRTVAKRAGVKTGQVVAVIWSMFDRASQAHERGSIEGFNPEILADAFDWETAEIQRIMDALTEVGVIKDGRLTAWSKYQPVREDGSAERAKEWRERKRTQANANEPKEHRYREDTDTDTERKKRVPRARSEREPVAPKVRTWLDDYRDVMRLSPPKDRHEEFAAEHERLGPDEFTRRLKDDWRDRGFNPKNVKGILDILRNGHEPDEPEKPFVQTPLPPRGEFFVGDFEFEPLPRSKR